jgi:hypothetical protein
MTATNPLAPSKALPRRACRSRRGKVPLDPFKRSYLVQITGDLRQARSGGGGPMSRCQTRPSSN